MSDDDKARRKREFQEAIKKAPNDYELHGVYADWLEEQGDHEEAAHIRSKPDARAIFRILRRELAESAKKWPALAEQIASIQLETCENPPELVDRAEVLARIAKGLPSHSDESLRAEILEAIATVRANRLTATQLDAPINQIELASLTEIVFHTFFSPDLGMSTRRVDPIEAVLTIRLGMATYMWNGGCIAASIDHYDARALNVYAGQAAPDPYVFNGEPDTALGRWMTEVRLSHRNPFTNVASVSVLGLSHYFGDADIVDDPWRSLIELAAEILRPRLPMAAAKKSLNTALHRCRVMEL